MEIKTRKPSGRVPPEVLEAISKQRFREWGRLGGLRGDKAKKAAGGRKGAKRRWAMAMRCPSCGRPIMPNFHMKDKSPAETRDIIEGDRAVLQANGRKPYLPDMPAKHQERKR